MAPGTAAAELTSSAPASPSRPFAAGSVSLPPAAQQPQPAADAAGAPGAERLEADRLKALLTDAQMRVRVHRDQASGHYVLLVEDRATGEAVDQIPSDTLLRLYAALRRPLVDERA